MTRWTAIPAARSSAPVLKVRLALVLGSLVFAAVCGVAAIVMVLTRPEPPAPQLPQGIPAAAAEAWTVARQYVAGQPPTIPVADGVATAAVGAKPLAGVATIEWQGYDTREPQSGRTVEYHRFLLTGPGPDGEPPVRRVLVVPVQVTAAGPVLVAAPSLGPSPVPAEVPAALDWTDVKSQVPVSDQLSRAVEVWAKAYLADDRPGLRDVVADPKGGQYAGIGGLEAKSVTTPALVARADDPTLSVARARVEAAGTGGWASQMEWDLLVRNSTQGNPEIVAWGPAGTGGFLAPYQNALSGTRQPAG